MRDGRVAPPSALLPRPTWRRCRRCTSGRWCACVLPAQPGASGWRVQVARRRRFDQLLADVRSATPELRIADLPDGRYPMRLRAVDAHGLEGRDARGC
jgi:hypothetical protein